MFWNGESGERTLSNRADKLQHKMFWNEEIALTIDEDPDDKLQHKMFWNDVRVMVCSL